MRTMYTAVQTWLSKSGILSLDGAFLESSWTRWHSVVCLSSCPFKRGGKIGRKLISRRTFFLTNTQTNARTTNASCRYTSSNAKSNSIYSYIRICMYKWGILHCSRLYYKLSKSHESEAFYCGVEWDSGGGMIDKGEETQQTPTFTPGWMIFRQSIIHFWRTVFGAGLFGTRLRVGSNGGRWAMSLSRPVETPSAMFKDISLPPWNTLHAITYTRANITSQKHNNKII